ncbi:metal-dependent hydrolase [Helicobacter sp. MIT 05-5294]|uniref:metal-dependent hydrolase n=1 Tax=Helicobacter sp. MIT 05-5294 TaxID=1548150 RepID=UPI000B1C3973|nr:metal-dependent hydrolase [Helicobacter sp. MIT 05-5294]TLD85708.1 metal-dependent hydrolase [Helicobacter sp. MIT 05-5294]
MLGKTHVSFGLGLSACGITGFTALTNTALSGAELGIFYGAVALGSLLPDIDEPNSLLGKKTLGISNLIKSIFGHRGFTHSLSFIVLLGILLPLLSLLGEKFWNQIPLIVEFSKAFGSVLGAQNLEFFGIGLLLGCVFHLIGDMMTLSGVPLLLPFKAQNYHITPPFMRFRTGGIPDKLITALSLAVFGYLNLELLGFSTNLKGYFP